MTIRDAFHALFPSWRTPRDTPREEPRRSTVAASRDAFAYDEEKGTSHGHEGR